MNVINKHSIFLFTFLIALIALVSCSSVKKTISASTINNPKPELIFQSGFEGTSKIVPFGASDNNIIGKDTTLTEKSDWVNDLDNSPDGGKFMLQYTGGDSTKRFAKIIPEPGNPSNKVLYFWLNDYWLASENQQKARVQANIMGIKTGYKEFYQSVRVFLHEDFKALRKYPSKIGWLTISEFWNNEWWSKNQKYGFRISLGIGKPNAQESDLNFILDAQDVGFKEIWKGDNTKIKVPIGKWFTMDYYLKEGDDKTGRFYMCITPDGEKKQVVFDITNFTHNTHDPSPDGLTDYNPLKLYTSKDVVSYMRSQGKTLQIYWDDFKLWKNKRPE